MRRKVLYSLKSPYRESLDVVGFSFGQGTKAAAVVGAFRGNEVQQMYVCSRLVQELKKLERQGELSPDHEILVIPCVNYYSMNIGQRFWAMDHTDINRMFPGYQLGETTQRIADGVFTQLQGYTFGIQLASFYQSGNFLPHVKLMETGFTDPEILKEFGMQYAIVRKPRPYDTTTLNYNWQIWGTQAVSLYTNATDRVDEKSAQDAVTAILRFLFRKGVIRRRIRSGYQTELIEEASIVQVHADGAGIFMESVEIGAHVEENEELGRILNPLTGEVTSRIRTHCPGVVYFIYNQPLISENTVCFKVIRDPEE